MTQHTIPAAACGSLLLAALTFSGTAAYGQAKTVPCSGPFAQCAAEVGAFCEVENGKTMMWYKDREGTSTRLEECMGRVYEKNGRRNPYKPAPANTAPKR